MSGKKIFCAVAAIPAILFGYVAFIKWHWDLFQVALAVFTYFFATFWIYWIFKEF